MQRDLLIRHKEERLSHPTSRIPRIPCPIYPHQRNQKRFLSTFPGLTKQLVKKHLPKSETTVKGHMDQERKNLQSTKKVPPIQPEPLEPATRTNIQIYVSYWQQHRASSILPQTKFTLTLQVNSLYNLRWEINMS